MEQFKCFAISSTNGLPIILGRTKGVEPRSRVLHNHPGIEINLILEGSSKIVISGRKYSCRRGDIVIIGEGAIHRAWDSDDATFLVAIFTKEILVDERAPAFERKFLLPFLALPQGVSPVIAPDAPFHDELADELLAIEREAGERGNSYRLMIKARLLVFSALLTRTLRIEDDSPILRRGLGDRRIETVKAFVEEYYSEKILVSDMAERVNMSRTNFARIFREEVGTTPLDFLIQTRIRHAAEMLLAGDRKVIDVANDCGFSSLSNFISCFKRITGVLPHAYREQL